MPRSAVGVSCWNFEASSTSTDFKISCYHAGCHRINLQAQATSPQYCTLQLGAARPTRAKPLRALFPHSCTSPPPLTHVQLLFLTDSQVKRGIPPHPASRLRTRPHIPTFQPQLRPMRQGVEEDTHRVGSRHNSAGVRRGAYSLLRAPDSAHTHTQRHAPHCSSAQHHIVGHALYSPA